MCLRRTRRRADSVRLEAGVVAVRAFLTEHWPHPFNVFVAPTAVPPPSGRNAPESEWSWQMMVAVICERERVAECRALLEGNAAIGEVRRTLEFDLTIEPFLDPRTLA